MPPLPDEKPASKETEPAASAMPSLHTGQEQGASQRHGPGIGIHGNLVEKGGISINIYLDWPDRGP
jgi:hypothetical protein